MSKRAKRRAIVIVLGVISSTCVIVGTAGGILSDNDGPYLALALFGGACALALFLFVENWQRQEN